MPSYFAVQDHQFDKDLPSIKGHQYQARTFDNSWKFLLKQKLLPLVKIVTMPEGLWRQDLWD